MDKPEDAPPGWRAILQPRYMASLTFVCLGVWLHAADGLLVATMLPAIVADIGGSALIAWTVALYEVGSITAGAAAALLSLRHGLRACMVGAAWAFALGCVVSAVAPTMPVMLAGRLLQGIGGGGLVALSFAAAGQIFPRALIPRVMAAISALWGLSAFTGPLIGGLFADYGIWRGGFWAFAGQAAALAVFAHLTVPDGAVARREAGGRLPLRRLAALSAGVVAIAAAGIAIDAVTTPLFMALGVALLALFVWLDASREGDRLLPHRAISLTDPVGAGLTLVIAFSAATVPIVLYGPILITGLHGVAALTAGYVVACASIGWTLAALAVAGVAERSDRRMILSGMLVICASILAFAILVPVGPVWAIAAIALAEGAGFGMAWTFILRRLTALAPPEEVERAAAALPTLQRLGYALGAAYAGIVANAAGLVGAETASLDEAALTPVAVWLFVACLPLAAVGLFALRGFLRAPLPMAGARHPLRPGTRPARLHNKRI
jgi:MFS family permease